MRVPRWLSRLLMGRAGRLSEAVAAQPREPLSLPAQVTLDGQSLTLRLLASGDREAMLTFARSLPSHDLLFLRRDITEPANVDIWLREVEAGTTTTVLALVDSQIVGYGTVASEGLSWTRHVRELRVMVGPSMRGKRLGRLLTEQAFAIARQQGAKKMVAQMTSDQRGAVQVFRRMGFEREARLRDQVVDRDGTFHDLEIMSLDIEAFQAKLDLAIAQAQNQYLPV